MTFIFTPNGNEPPYTLEIVDDHILIRELEIRHLEAAHYLRQLPHLQQEAALVGIFEMGVLPADSGEEIDLKILLRDS